MWQIFAVLIGVLVVVINKIGNKACLTVNTFEQGYLLGLSISIIIFIFTFLMKVLQDKFL